MSKQFMLKKIVGGVLLAVGILMILWGIWSSYNIFTAKKPAPEIFKEAQVEKVTTSTKKSGSAEEQMQQQMQQVIGEQLSKFLPGGLTTGLLNLIAWSIFMGILVFAAGNLSTLGIRLLKA